MAKKAAGVQERSGAGAAITEVETRERLPGEFEQPVGEFDSIQDEQTEAMPAAADGPIISLADLLDRAAFVTDEELAAGSKASYQLREGRTSVQVTLESDLADPLRRMLLVLNRSNARIGTGALTRNVANKADAIRKLMELLAAEIGERASA